jgi:hypothetical protein
MITAQQSNTFSAFQSRLANYLPDVAAGAIVLLLGVGAGWLAKRVVVRGLVWLRLDRLAGTRSWRAAFAKGDVRSGLYDRAGSVVMILVFLLFLENALQIWGLVVPSRLLESVLEYLPNVALAGLIVGLGVFLSDMLADRVEDALEEEGMARPRLVARTLKAALLAVVTALALWQLNFAREIVLAGFLITFGALGLAFAIGVGVGTSRAVERALDAMLDKSRER